MSQLSAWMSRTFIFILFVAGRVMHTDALTMKKSQKRMGVDAQAPPTVAMSFSGNGCLSETIQMGFYRTFMAREEVSLVSTNSGGSWLMGSLLYAPSPAVTRKEVQRWLTDAGAYDPDGKWGTSCLTQGLASLKSFDKPKLQDFLTKCFQEGGENENGSRQQFGVVDWCAHGSVEHDEELVEKLSKIPQTCAGAMKAIVQIGIPALIKCYSQELSDAEDLWCMDNIFASRFFTDPPCGKMNVVVAHILEKNGIPWNQTLSNLSVSTLRTLTDDKLLVTPTWAICQARYTSNFGHFHEDVWEHVRPGRVIVDPRTIALEYTNYDRLAHAEGEWQLNGTYSQSIGPAESLHANILASSNALNALELEDKYRAELLLNVPKPGMLGATPTAAWLRNPKRSGQIVSDCANIENTGILTAVKFLDDTSERFRPGVLVSLISESRFYYVNSFFVDHLDIFTDTSVSMDQTRLPFQGAEGRTGWSGVSIIKNHNKVFRLAGQVDFNGHELSTGEERQRRLKRCFDQGTCLVKVQVQLNPFWNIRGGWRIWLHMIMQNSNSALVRSFEEVLPVDVRNEWNGGFKSTADFGGMTKARAWAYMNMGSLYALDALCQQRYVFRDREPKMAEVPILLEQARSMCGNLSSQVNWDALRGELQAKDFDRKRSSLGKALWGESTFHALQAISSQLDQMKKHAFSYDDFDFDDTDSGGDWVGGEQRRRRSDSGEERLGLTGGHSEESGYCDEGNGGHRTVCKVCVSCPEKRSDTGWDGKTASDCKALASRRGSYAATFVKSSISDHHCYLIFRGLVGTKQCQNINGYYNHEVLGEENKVYECTPQNAVHSDGVYGWLPPYWTGAHGVCNADLSGGQYTQCMACNPNNAHEDKCKNLLQDQLMPWTGKNKEACRLLARKHGADAATYLFWNDCHQCILYYQGEVDCNEDYSTGKIAGYTKLSTRGNPESRFAINETTQLEVPQHKAWLQHCWWQVNAAPEAEKWYYFDAGFCRQEYPELQNAETAQLSMRECGKMCFNNDDCVFFSYSGEVPGLLMNCKLYKACRGHVLTAEDRENYKTYKLTNFRHPKSANDTLKCGKKRDSETYVQETWWIEYTAKTVQSDVAGVIWCNEQCQPFKFFRLSNPSQTDQTVTCECGSGLEGIMQVPADDCANYTAGNYMLGGAERFAVYLVIHQESEEGAACTLTSNAAINNVRPYIKHYGDVTVSDCEALCHGDPECKSFDYARRNNTCAWAADFIPVPAHTYDMFDPGNLPPSAMVLNFHEHKDHYNCNNQAAVPRPYAFLHEGMCNYRAWRVQTYRGADNPGEGDEKTIAQACYLSCIDRKPSVNPAKGNWMDRTAYRFSVDEKGACYCSGNEDCRLNLESESEYKTYAINTSMNSVVKVSEDGSTSTQPRKSMCFNITQDQEHIFVADCFCHWNCLTCRLIHEDADTEEGQSDWEAYYEHYVEGHQDYCLMCKQGQARQILYRASGTGYCLNEIHAFESTLELAQSTCQGTDETEIPGCKCHPSCAKCGFSDEPIYEDDCIECANGDPIVPQNEWHLTYVNHTGYCKYNKSKNEVARIDGVSLQEAFDEATESLNSGVTCTSHEDCAGEDSEEFNTPYCQDVSRLVTGNWSHHKSPFFRCTDEGRTCCMDENADPFDQDTSNCPTSGFATCPENGPASTCYTDFGDVIEDCQCHSSCHGCGYASTMEALPTGIDDCIFCPPKVTGKVEPPLFIKHRSFKFRGTGPCQEPVTQNYYYLSETSWIAP